MEEGKEELEPLFDYSRIQPIDFVYIDDDCSVSPPFFPTKRKRVSNPSVEGKFDDCEAVNVDENEPEEEDWLPPPPKKLVNTAAVALEGDPTIRELRLKQQELASFALSAEDILREVEESVKRELRVLSCSGKSAEDLEGDHPSKSNDKREKIIISFQDKDGHKQFRVFMDEKFERLFKMYADKVSRKLESLAFCFDGDKVSPTATPESIGLENNDIIEVHAKSS